MECLRWTTPACFIIGCLLITGCDRKDPPASGASGASASPSASEAPALTSDQQTQVKAGDTVVVESGEASFWPGRVLTVDGNTVTYEFGSNRSKGDAPKEKVYVIGPDHTTVARPQDFAICKTAPTSWNPCVVKQVENTTYVVEDLWGKPYNLTASDVLVPNEEARARIEAKHRESSKHREFMSAVHSAGDPRLPEGWVARPGDDVIAKFTDSSWYSGRIRRITPTKIHIAWDDRMTPSERDHREVAPKPTDPQQVEEGQYVLGRPRTGTRWDYFYVESVDERGVLLVDKDGRKKKVPTRDVIPLEK